MNKINPVITFFIAPQIDNISKMETACNSEEISEGRKTNHQNRQGMRQDEAILCAMFRIGNLFWGCIEDLPESEEYVVHPRIEHPRFKNQASCELQKPEATLFTPSNTLTCFSTLQKDVEFLKKL